MTSPVAGRALVVLVACCAAGCELGDPPGAGAGPAAAATATPAPSPATPPSTPPATEAQAARYPATPTATADAGPATETDAGAPAWQSTPRPPEPTELIPLEATARGAAAEVRLSAVEGSNDVPIDAELELASEVALIDLRVRLIDGDEKLVPSTDQAQVGRGTRYVIRPQAPLVPGSDYRIVVDGLTEAYPTDAGGRHYRPRSLRFRTAGEKPEPPPPPPKPRKRGRR